VFTLQIGAGSGTTGTLDVSTFSGASRWLEVSVEGETLTPRLALTTVPYAFQAQEAAVAATAREVSVRNAQGSERVLVDTQDDAGIVVAKGPSGKAAITLTTLAADHNFGSLAVSDATGERVRIDARPPGGGLVETYGPSGKRNVRLSFSVDHPDSGSITVHDANGERAVVEAAATGAGLMQTFGPGGQPNVTLSHHSTDPDLGLVTVAGDGANRVIITAAPSGNGVLGTYGPSGKLTTALASLPDSPDAGAILATDASGERVVIRALPGGVGSVQTLGPGAKTVARLTASDDDPNQGLVSAHNANGDVASQLSVCEHQVGTISTFAPEGKVNVHLTHASGAPGIGTISIFGADGNVAAETSACEHQAGSIATWGPSGKVNVWLTHPSGLADVGWVGVFDRNGNYQAALGVRSDGKGYVEADIKNFVIAHPGRPGFHIMYSSLEGPEVAMYTRGVVRLEHGSATVTLPEHFTALAVPGTLTLQLTPGSFSSVGVGFEIGQDGRIEVRELGGGTGSYDVHYVVHAVRKGHEDFVPVVSDAELTAGIGAGAEWNSAAAGASRAELTRSSRRSADGSGHVSAFAADIGVPPAVHPTDVR
jgi:hypothetical protein